MKAILFGSIGTIAETSDMQRRAFNRAFEEAGLDWIWTEAEYAQMLKQSGGKDRIARFAEERGESVDAEALHARKSELFQDALKEGVSLRPGVGEVMALARDEGHKIGFVTTTSEANVDQILAATGLSRDDFAVITVAGDVEASKPDPAIYEKALAMLGLSADEAIAVEDNPDGFQAARAAGLQTIAFPGHFHSDSDFPGAMMEVDHLVLPEERAAA